MWESMWRRVAPLRELSVQLHWGCRVRCPLGADMAMTDEGLGGKTPNGHLDPVAMLIKARAVCLSFFLRLYLFKPSRIIIICRCQASWADPFEEFSMWNASQEGELALLQRIDVSDPSVWWKRVHFNSFILLLFLICCLWSLCSAASEGTEVKERSIRESQVKKTKRKRHRESSFGLSGLRTSFQLLLVRAELLHFIPRTPSFGRSPSFLNYFLFRKIIS